MPSALTRFKSGEKYPQDPPINFLKLYNSFFVREDSEKSTHLIMSYEDLRLLIRKLLASPVEAQALD